jgi:outer membrane protein assembly factor BamC
VNPFFKVAALGVAVSFCACSSLETDKVDYRSAAKAPALSVPPDLTQLSKDTRYSVIDGGVSATGFQANQAAAAANTSVANLSLNDVRIERLGNQRWLVIKRPAEKLWEPVKEFWIDNGFLLAMDQSNLGIMETDWAENRAKIPQDFVRNSLGKIFDSLYSTGERDRFRTRLERGSDGSTEIFISHRGVIEVYSGTNREQNQTVWQPRPSDPELEAEFLRRLMVKLGSTQEQAKALVASSVAKSIATVSTANGQPVLTLEEGFDRAWRRVGLALDRTGFTVEDRDRKQGIYFVRYVPPNPDSSQPGFFSKLFSSSKTTEAAKFRIAVLSQTNRSTVSVMDDKGKPETSATAARIVQVLADDIK